MTSPSMQKLQEISITLNRGRINPEVSRTTVEAAIKSVAGSSKRTLDHYTKLLCRADIIIYVRQDVFSLDVPEVRHDMLKNIRSWLLGA